MQCLAGQPKHSLLVRRALRGLIARTVLVPSVMHVLGRANWWLPGWLDRRLPRLHVEPAELTSAGVVRQPTAVGPRVR